jgi:hypothetical protein
MWAAHHADSVSDGVMSPHVCPPVGTLERGVVLMRCTFLGVSRGALRDAPGRARQAARAAAGHGVYVPCALSVSSSTPCILAQRVARFDPYSTHSGLLPKH